VWFSTWKTDLPLDELRSEVDALIIVPEPTNVDTFFKARTQQMRQLPNETRGWASNVYKMFVGVEEIFKIAPLANDDIVIRARADVFFKCDPNHLQELLERAKTCYVSRSDRCDDWFGIGTYATIKNIWCWRNLTELETMMNKSWNTENVIYNKAVMYNIPIVKMDPTKVDICIMRSNMFKHYYP